MNKLDPQYSRLGAMVAAICANNLVGLKSLLQRDKHRKMINDPLPFVITEHKIFSALAEVDKNDQRISEIRSLLGCAAYLNRLDCLKLLKKFGGVLVRVSLLKIFSLMYSPPSREINHFPSSSPQVICCNCCLVVIVSSYTSC
jgi:hypothetical protein